MSKTRRIFLVKEDYEELERHARRKGMSVQGYVDAAVDQLKEAKPER